VLPVCVVQVWISRSISSTVCRARKESQHSHASHLPPRPVTGLGSPCCEMCILFDARGLFQMLGALLLGAYAPTHWTLLLVPLQEEELRQRQADEEGTQLHGGLASVPLPKPPPLPAGPKPGLPPPPMPPPLPSGPGPAAAGSSSNNLAGRPLGNPCCWTLSACKHPHASNMEETFQ